MINFNWLETDNDLSDEGVTRKWLNRVLSDEGFLAGDIQYIFCRDSYLLQLNQQFLQHDDYTDILTFPMGNADDTISGEIYISVERVSENAARYEVVNEHELRRVMVHGMLHLAGYPDASPAEKSIMRAKEDYYLNLHP